MAAISKEVQDLARQEWFPNFMHELGYEAVVRCGECIYEQGCVQLIITASRGGRTFYHVAAVSFCSNGKRRADDE